MLGRLNAWVTCEKILKLMIPNSLTAISSGQPESINFFTIPSFPSYRHPAERLINRKHILNHYLFHSMWNSWCNLDLLNRLVFHVRWIIQNRNTDRNIYSLSDLSIRINQKWKSNRRSSLWWSIKTEGHRSSLDPKCQRKIEETKLLLRRFNVQHAREKESKKKSLKLFFEKEVDWWILIGASLSSFGWIIEEWNYSRTPAAFKSANSLTTCSGIGGGVGRWSPVAWKPFSSATQLTVRTTPSASVKE